MSNRHEAARTTGEFLDQLSWGHVTFDHNLPPITEELWQAWGKDASELPLRIRKPLRKLNACDGGKWRVIKNSPDSSSLPWRSWLPWKKKPAPSYALFRTRTSATKELIREGSGLGPVTAAYLWGYLDALP